MKKYLIIIMMIVFLGAANVSGYGVGLLDATKSSTPQGYLKKYEWHKWNSVTSSLDKFCHITYDIADPNSYRIYDKDGNFIGVSSRPALNVNLDVGTHYFALKVEDNLGGVSGIRMENRTILDPNDEWIVMVVSPVNGNRPPIIYLEKDLIVRRDAIILLRKINSILAYTFL